MRVRRDWCVLLLGCALATASGSGSTAQVLPGEVAGGSELVTRFLSEDGTPLTQFRALRRLDAVSRGGKTTASLTAWTELDPVTGLRTEIVSEEGSGHIRKRVFRRFLDNELEAAQRGGRRATFTLENYEFAPPVPDSPGLVRVGITPRRADPLLIDGDVLLTAPGGDLVRVEGRLAKRPSFWTRRVDVVRRYGRVAGVRVPLAMESQAQVRIMGASSFTVVWEYESVNGQRVGSPVPDVLTTSRDRARPEP